MRHERSIGDGQRRLARPNSVDGGDPVCFAHVNDGWIADDPCSAERGASSIVFDDDFARVTGKHRHDGWTDLNRGGRWPITDEERDVTCAEVSREIVGADGDHIRPASDTHGARKE